MESWEKLNHEIVTCRRCPRLVSWREEVARVKRRAYREQSYWGKPVPGFGDPRARLVIIGLAPGAHGSNRTGRMFTGDSSGDTLFRSLYRVGFATQPQAYALDDDLELRDVFITAVARCVPPRNRPTAQELANCRSFLARELALLTRVRVVLALGKVAFDGYVRLLREQGAVIPRLGFAHGLHVELGSGLPLLVASYHPSRQNTQTGRLTQDRFDSVFLFIKAYLEESLSSRDGMLKHR